LTRFISSPQHLLPRLALLSGLSLGLASPALAAEANSLGDLESGLDYQFRLLQGRLPKAEQNLIRREQEDWRQSLAQECPQDKAATDPAAQAALTAHCLREEYADRLAYLKDAVTERGPFAILALRTSLVRTYGEKDVSVNHKAGAFVVNQASPHLIAPLVEGLAAWNKRLEAPAPALSCNEAGAVTRLFHIAFASPHFLSFELQDWTDCASWDHPQSATRYETAILIGHELHPLTPEMLFRLDQDWAGQVAAKALEQLIPKPEPLPTPAAVSDSPPAEGTEANIAPVEPPPIPAPDPALVAAVNKAARDPGHWHLSTEGLALLLDDRTPAEVQLPWNALSGVLKQTPANLQ